uniref:CSON015075 protein n=1 Tax=Culicoides sonorensis TaxID=179676 RepID=A0A336MGH8_CULSO
MVCIDDLFDWILETIFNYLPRHYRLICKEVCQRWYELLMTRSIFQKDRHIYLTKCLVEPNRPPMSIFMKAKYPYQLLTIDNGNIYHPIFKDIGETLEFWQYLGESITDIHIKNNMRPILYGILYEMPNIKTIYIHDTFDRSVSDFRRLQRDQISDKPLLPNLETFRTKGTVVEPRGRTLTNVELLKSIITSKFKIQIDGIAAIRNTEYKKIQDVLDVAEINSILFQGTVQVNSNLNDLLNLNKNPFKRIKFNFKDEKVPIDYLNALFEKHTNIEMISLVGVIPTKLISYPKITHLHITEQLEDDKIKSLKILEPLVNLKALTISIPATDLCLIGHEAINLPKLLHLEIENMNVSCNECLTALTSSFPYLQKFEGRITQSEPQIHIDLMLKNWKYLTSMKIGTKNVNTARLNIGQTLNFPEDQRTYLRTLKITARPAFKLLDEEIVKLGILFPNLNSFSLTYDHTSENLANLTKCILSSFPELTKLSIDAYCFSVDFTEEESELVIENIKQYGKKLRVLETPVLNTNLNEAALSLYRSLENLVLFNYDRERWQMDKLEEIEKNASKRKSNCLNSE